jgi:hypothetical protein
MLSSAWESEQRQHDMVDWRDPNNNWMRPEVRQEIAAFQDTVIEQEFAAAVERGDVEEIYWVGGEPLMYEQHWRYMRRIIEKGDGPRVYARYNTNLHRIHYRGHDLFADILDHMRDWQICASLDGTGETGEYIRDGLDYERWLANYQHGLRHRRYSRQMRIDFTLTLPGMLEVERIQQLAQDLDSEVLAKLIFSFTPDIIMSPLALPRQILDDWIDRTVPLLSPGAIRDVIVQLKQRPVFEEQWPDSYRSALAMGKARLQRIDRIRGGKTLADILQQEKTLHEWYQQI